MFRGSAFTKGVDLVTFDVCFFWGPFPSVASRRMTLNCDK